MADEAIPETKAQGSGPFEKIRRVAESDALESIVATLLVLNAGALALEYVADAGTWDTALWVFFWVSQVVFVVEIVLRVLGYGPRFGDFFKDGWNVFDFVLVAASLVPIVGPWSLLARIVRVLRVLRVLRLVSLYGRRQQRKDAPP